MNSIIKEVVEIFGEVVLPPVASLFLVMENRISSYFGFTNVQIVRVERFYSSFFQRDNYLVEIAYDRYGCMLMEFDPWLRLCHDRYGRPSQVFSGFDSREELRELFSLLETYPEFGDGHGMGKIVFPRRVSTLAEVVSCNCVPNSAGEMLIKATWSDGKSSVIGRYFFDEKCFTGTEFIGKTLPECQKILFDADVAYLQK